MINDDIADELDTRSYKDTSIDLMIPNQKYKKMEFKSNKEIENELNKEMVLKALRSRGQIGATSSEIAEITGRSRSTESFYLNKLSDWNLINKMKLAINQKQVFFEIPSEVASKISNILENPDNFLFDKLDVLLKNYLTNYKHSLFKLTKKRYG